MLRGLQGQVAIKPTHGPCSGPAQHSTAPRRVCLVLQASCVCLVVQVVVVGRGSAGREGRSATRGRCGLCPGVGRVGEPGCTAGKAVWEGGLGGQARPGWPGGQGYNLVSKPWPAGF